MKKVAATVMTAMLLMVVLCGTGAAQSVQPRNWVVCPRCGAPVTQSTDESLLPAGEVPCSNGYGKDTLYNQVRITDYTCAAGCGFENQDKLSLSFFAPCDHLTRTALEGVTHEERLAQVVEELQNIIGNYSSETRVAENSLPEEEASKLKEQIERIENDLAK